MTAADETTQRIAALQKRLVELDRERDNVLVDIAKLERLREAMPSPATMRPAQKPYQTTKKSLCFARCSGAATTYFLADGRIQKPVSRATRRFVEMSGSAAFVKSRG
jgi:hypothetical protein